MRYFLCFFFLFLYSYSVFAEDPPQPICPEFIVISCLSPGYESTFSNTCLSADPKNAIFSVDNSVCYKPQFGDREQRMECRGQCSCPPGSSFHSGFNISTQKMESGCVPDLPPSGGSDCDELDMVYDPVSGSMVCPASGDSSSSPSSSSCLVPGDFNGDCVPDNEQGSSAAASVPAPPPTSGSNTSSPSTGGGGGDSGDTPSTGGGGGSGGGSGGASGSASNTSSGSNSSWTPNSGYGNWIPVPENSNCPNKYKDNAGQWWCSGSTNQGSAASASGACDPTSTNYWSCINSGSAGSAGSSGSTSSDNSEGRLSEKSDELIQGLKEDVDTELDNFEKAYSDDIDAFTRDGVPFDSQPSAIKSILISFLPVSTSCNPPKLEMFGESFELDCYYFDIFKQVFGWFLTIVTAFQIWQMAIRPVER